MIKYTESKWTITFLILILIIEILSIIIIFKKGEFIKFILFIFGFIFCTLIFIATCQQEVLIDEDKITLKLGLPFLYKPKTMAWENVDIVGKDSVLGVVIYRLATRCPVKPKAINISGIKNMDSMIVEIVKRAKFASIDPKILKVIEKYNKK
jgi:hypothetical protein